MKNIILIGHSHTNCLYAGFSEVFSAKYSVRQIHLVHLLAKMKQDKNISEELSFNSYFLKALDKSVESFENKKNYIFRGKAKINLVLLLGGSYHNIIGLFKMTPAFDFIHPDYPDLELDEKAEIIPFNAIKNLLYAEVCKYEEILSVISDLSFNALHLEPPPPLDDEQLIMDNLESYFTDRYNSPRLANPNIRFKLWRLYSDLFCGLCKKYNVPYIPAPETMIINGKFLKREAYLDTIHANRFYAEHYINLLESRLV